ncbi:MAG TPA: O-antigen ligase family protein [Burkholderiales bacterium]|jgi:O-antigen ligase
MRAVIVDTALAWIAAMFLATSLFAHTVTFRLVLLIVGAALAGVTVWRNRSDTRLLPPILLPFLLWAGWAWLSVVWSIEPERTLKELRNEIVYTGLALWVCFVAAQVANAARIVIPVVGAAAAAVMAIGLRDYSIGWERYVVGLHGGPGDHSSALLTLAPCVAMTAWYAWRTGSRVVIQLPVWILALLIPASAYCTLNRTVWIGLGVEVLLIGLLIRLRQRESMRRPWSARAKVASGLVAVAVVGGAAVTLDEIQAKREAVGGTTLAADHRLLLWPEIFELIDQRPLTGYGFGRGLLRRPLRAEFGTVDGQLWHAHNTFLEQLIQLGVPGLALFVLLLAAILREGWRLTLDASDFRTACGIALIGVLAGMLVRNMTDTLFVRGNSLLFWGVTGTLLGLAIVRRRQPAQGVAA